jgi:hypothetical protein
MSTTLGRVQRKVLASLCGSGFACLGVLACGSEAALPTGSAPEQDEDLAEVDVAPDEFAIANAAPGYAPFEYPPGPYGTARGAVIENLQFLGWHSPLAAGYQATTMGAVGLSDFYDPDGQKGIELLLINAVAVWCSVCRTEYADIVNNQLYEQLQPRGVEFLGVLFEDNNADPARYVDMESWSSAYGVSFPFVLDPGFKTGVYFDRSATPMNMLVDARTMQVLQVITGYDPALYEEVDAILTERGR